MSAIKGHTAMRAIVVTGGAGFIGSHVCKAIAQRGHLPVTIDNLSMGHEDAVKWGPLFRCDIGDKDAVAEVAERHQATEAIHLAGFIAVGESVVDPAKYYRNNVAGSIALLDGLMAGGVNRIVFSSSAAVYGTPTQTPIPETHATNPESPYGWTKLTIERVLADYGPVCGFRSASLRYFNAAGADPDGELGERHEPETHLIPLALQAAAGLRPELSVFGTDYPTRDGTAVRDYIHVSDLAEAHCLALDWLESQAATTFDAFNLGSNEGHTVRETIATAQRVTGREIPTRDTARRACDPAILVASNTKAKDLLGWSPRFPSLDDQIRHAWNWLQAHV
jgi:UDP-glucose-4-epimerase GalE